MARKTGDDVPGMVREFLPKAMDKVVRSYNLFLQKKIENWGENEAFGKNHTAGKAAIAHIQMILKLSQQLDLKETESGMSTEEVEKLLEAAQTEYDAYANSCAEDGEEMA